MKRNTARAWQLALTCLVSAACASDSSQDATQAKEQAAPLTLPPGFDALTPTWEMAGHDVFAHHNNPLEIRLRKRTVQNLEVLWTFDKAKAGADVGAFHGTPVVSRDGLFAGSTAGRFFALNLDGSVRWTFDALPPNPLLGALTKPSPVGGVVPTVYGTPIVGGAIYSDKHNLVVFGDMDGNIYALDADTGAQRWVKPQLDPHPLGGIVGNSLLRVGDRVVIGFSATEDAGLVLPQLGVPYRCCSHTGLVVTLDLATGAEIWRYDTIAPSDVQQLGAAFAPFQLGPSGADIWGQPSFDPASNTVYIGTGQNYSPKPTGGGTATSDALIALDASTGKPRWVTQVVADDIWVSGIPSPDANGRWTDQDFGDAPKIYRLPNGRKVVGAGTKAGTYYVVDARTGQIITKNELFQQANQLGGIQNGGAYGRGKVFLHGLDGSDPLSSQAPFLGSVVALSPDGRSVKWRFDQPQQLLVGPLTLAGELLYFIAPVAEPAPGSDPFQYALFALDADSGEVVHTMPFAGRAVSGPVVSRGRVYVASGNTAVAAIGVVPEGAITCLGLPKRHGQAD